MCGREFADFNLQYLDMDLFYSLEPLFDIVEEVTLMGWGEPTLHPNFEKMLRVIGRHAARSYFCTNGMRLHTLHDTLFACDVDVFAVSVDGANPETNNAIRRGSNLLAINDSLRAVVRTKRERGLTHPYINYVFCAMRRNLRELPSVVEMAAEIGLEEVKVVFLTAFDEGLATETLYGCEREIVDVFTTAVLRAKELGILLKLPYVRGTDPAGVLPHRDCFVGYRDFFLGSDGYVRPCMSTAEKFFLYDKGRDFHELWNAPAFTAHRARVNTPDMSACCRNCYQSSHCNWNLKQSYKQTGAIFAPIWQDVV
jgi:MoaA/NifB/PqqE/SkfB family radical SAM enzyme